MKKPYTHASFGQPHLPSDYYTAREDAGGTPRETLQYQLRYIDVTASRRHNEGSGDAVQRLALDAIAMREVIEGLLQKKRGSVTKARQLLQGLDAVQALSDEHWEKKRKHEDWAKKLAEAQAAAAAARKDKTP
jgi:aryl carrier-like protein